MQRDLKLDGLKFIMIFAVVLGHIDFSDWGMKTHVMITYFHMPVFVFLSGYFTAWTATREKRVKWLKRTLLTFVIAHCAYVLLLAALGDKSLLSWRGLVSPGYLWYLVCLIYWRLAVWHVFSRWNDVVLLVSSVVLAALSGLVPIGHEFSFQRAFAFFPFFALGVVFRRRELLPRLDRVPAAYAWVALLIGLLIARRLPIYLPKGSYLDWKDAVLRNMQGALGLLLSLSIVRVSRVRLVEFFAPFGQYTLWIYVGHIYLITLGAKFFPIWGIQLNLFTAFLLAAVYCAFFVGLAKLYHHGFRHRSGV